MGSLSLDALGAFCGTLFAFLASMVFSYAVWADNGDAAGASREA